jgi:hypothetical protein
MPKKMINTLNECEKLMHYSFKLEKLLMLGVSGIKHVFFI